MPPTNSQPEASTDKRSADIAIVCSVRTEVAPLLHKLDRVRKYVDQGAVFRGGFLDETLRIAVVEAGAGFAKHREVTQTLLAEHHPVWVLSVGFSSPLTEELKPGDVCVANEIWDTHGNSLTVKCSIPESKRVLVRKHVVADSHPRLRSERTALAESSGAIAVDTTSLAVAQACQSHEEDKPAAARFLSIRGMAGAFDQDLTQQAIEAAFEPVRQKKANLIGRLKSKVKPDPEQVAWQMALDEAAVNLNRFVLGIIRQLGEKLGRSRWP
ncbi:MAG: hypothetical protein R3C59_05645 [Planctomycetaceae bacterium]